MKVNTLLGESEGNQRREQARDQYKRFARSSLEGSLEDGERRSRSRSKRAKLEEAMRNAHQHVSMADLMRNSPSA